MESVLWYQNIGLILIVMLLVVVGRKNADCFCVDTVCQKHYSS